MDDLIWSAQRMTGWRIPVYLLVSGCEELTGFADWVLALPRQARQQILGWSVPYALDSVFEPKWIDEGISEVGRQLSVAQLLLMMPEPEVGVAEGLLLFPGEVQRLAAALSVLLTRMLRTSACQRRRQSGPSSNPSSKPSTTPPRRNKIRAT